VSGGSGPGSSKETRIFSGYSRGATGSVRGVRRQPCARSTKPQHGSTTRSGARPCPEMGRGCERWSRSSMYAVKRTSIWGRVAARQHGAGTAKGVEAHLTVRRSEVRYRSVTAKVSCPEIERSTSARVVCRLQKSVRSIFSSLDRGEPRGKPRRRGVARHGSSFLDEGSFIASGERVRGGNARTNM
jgi:hypothetical protein